MNVYPALPPGASPTLDTPEVFAEVVLVIHDTAIFSLHGKAPDLWEPTTMIAKLAGHMFVAIKAAQDALDDDDHIGAMSILKHIIVKVRDA